MQNMKTGKKDINGIEIKIGDKLKWDIRKIIHEKGTVVFKEYEDGEGYYNDIHHGIIVESLDRQTITTLPDVMRYNPEIIN